MHYLPFCHSMAYIDSILSHNNLCFNFNITVTNFLVSHTCEIRFRDAIGRSTVHMYSEAKILKHD